MSQGHASDFVLPRVSGHNMRAMGKLVYGAIQRQISIDDRTLVHLEAVLLSRLRRGSPFSLRWVETITGDGDGRRTIWIHPSSDLYFEYEGVDVGPLDRDLLEKLARSADSNSGINLGFDASNALWNVPE